MQDPNAPAVGTVLFTPGRWDEVVVSMENLPALPPDRPIACGYGCKMAPSFSAANSFLMLKVRSSPRSRRPSSPLQTTEPPRFSLP
ncbi:hypothetical protein [Thermoleptolyngbya sp. M55_K2018_002]|uniref:hypothetical protein n=1 Tax=Thermoleptolyngbya sp. M55_K2018_002 TaxID=2747808 RepID=UPI0019F49F2A|nr:hypothetical protein [Thermoleptolyngbya sp. M55_K2018_002]HIK39316.1 hypothetical protein [Thermoleptolyngbya sp. M55_K2018_002]